MIHQYSLADYQLTIGLSDEVANQLGLRDSFGNILKSFSIGGPGENGEGSFVGSITVNRNQDLFTTEIFLMRLIIIASYLERKNATKRSLTNGPIFMKRKEINNESQS